MSVTHSLLFSFFAVMIWYFHSLCSVMMTLSLSLSLSFSLSHSHSHHIMSNEYINYELWTIKPFFKNIFLGSQIATHYYYYYYYYYLSICFASQKKMIMSQWEFAQKALRLSTTHNNPSLGIIHPQLVCCRCHYSSIAGGPALPISQLHHNCHSWEERRP
jgi:hypothetical protein